MLIYKLLHAAEWAALDAEGQFAGSADDRRDGFIHLSTAEQLPGTFIKYFAGAVGTVVAVVDSVSLGTMLRWEPSRGGALFPHLYDILRRDTVVGMRAAADEPLLR